MNEVDEDDCLAAGVVRNEGFLGGERSSVRVRIETLLSASLPSGGRPANGTSGIADGVGEEALDDSRSLTRSCT